MLVIRAVLHSHGDEFDEDAVDDESEGTLSDPQRGVAVRCVRVEKAVVCICVILVDISLSWRILSASLPFCGH